MITFGLGGRYPEVFSMKYQVIGVKVHVDLLYFLILSSQKSLELCSESVSLHSEAETTYSFISVLISRSK